MDRLDQPTLHTTHQGTKAGSPNLQQSPRRQKESARFPCQNKLLISPSRAPTTACSPARRSFLVPNPSRKEQRLRRGESNPRCAVGLSAPSARPRSPGPSASRPPPPPPPAVSVGAGAAEEEETPPRCPRFRWTGTRKVFELWGHLGSSIYLIVRFLVVERRFRSSYNVSPGAYLPVGVVRVRPVGGDGGGGVEEQGPVLQCMKWGLVPSFTGKTEKPDHFRMVWTGRYIFTILCSYA